MELESYSRTAAEQIFDVDNAGADPELKPLKQEQLALGTKQDPHQ